MTEDEKQQRAEKQFRVIMGFYIHLTVYALVVALLAAINAMTAAPWWAQWPALGWGIGILAHGLAVFAGAPGAFSRWRERKIEEIKSSM